MSTTTNGNPIKRAAELRAYPGWLVREYADGMVDVAQIGGLALSPGFTSWAEAIDWLRTECGANVVTS